MIAALGTLVFLGTLWLLVVIGATILEASGDRIAAALKREQVRQPVLSVAPVRVRARMRPARVSRAQPRLRAAA
jgi:hypothetical protein